MSVAVAFDVSRLFIGPLSRTPRGIDRVDLEYARHYFADSGREVFAVLPTPWGVRTFPRKRVLRGLQRLESLWAEDRPAETDQVWHRLRAQMLGEKPDETRLPPFGNIARAGRMLALLGGTGFSFGRPVTRALPQGAVYINAGHTSLAVPFLLRWLTRRPDVKPVFMLHDVIPIETPHFVSDSLFRLHSTMVDETARHAAAVIVTTHAAKASVLKALADRGRPDMPAVALQLPAPTVFNTTPDGPDPDLVREPYFVMCGAVEPRKNHEMIVRVWERLVTRYGDRTPRVIMVGPPGFRSEEIGHMIRSSESTRPFIQRASGLGSQAMIRLLRGATASLMPSFAEGFGLPVIEAGILGTPVLASDIAAHREVAPRGTVFLDPQDVAAWERAVVDMMEHAESYPRVPTPPPMATWADYFRGLDAFLAELTAPRPALAPRRVELTPSLPR